MAERVLQTMDFMNEQPLIPYPRGAGRQLLRLPILLYEMGLGDLMNGVHIMILGTRGRRSGAPRYTPIEYRCHGSKIYIVSLWDDKPHWFQNLKAAPNVLVQQGQRHFGARAEVVTNAGEALRVLHLFRRSAPFLYDPLIARMSDRERVSTRTLPEISERITIVRLERTENAPDLQPVPVKYGWLAPMLFGVVIALTLILALTRSRQHGE